MIVHGIVQQLREVVANHNGVFVKVCTGVKFRNLSLWLSQWFGMQAGTISKYYHESRCAFGSVSWVHGIQGDSQLFTRSSQVCMSSVKDAWQCHAMHAGVDCATMFLYFPCAQGSGPWSFQECTHARSGHPFCGEITEAAEGKVLLSQRSAPGQVYSADGWRLLARRHVFVLSDFRAQFRPFGRLFFVVLMLAWQIDQAELVGGEAEF